MIISILNQKGGVGKTTLAINLARAIKLQECGEVLLVDSDPQRSTRHWNVEAQGELLNVIALDTPTLPKDIQPFIKDYSWIFIDGAGKLNSMSVAALKCSDIVLIPIQPSPLDCWATIEFIELVKERIELTDGKLKAAFIISQQKHNTILAREIRQWLLEYKASHNIDTFSSGTFSRTIYPTAFASGQTVLDIADNEASREIESIANELRGYIV